jgi:hypothetical protein
VPRRIEDEEIAEIVRLILETTPADATHWSLRSMAAAVGHAPSRVRRLWKAFCRKRSAVPVLRDVRGNG